MFESILHIIWHAFKDSIITLPILFICYLLIELLEEKILNKYQKISKEYLLLLQMMKNAYLNPDTYYTEQGLNT